MIEHIQQQRQLAELEFERISITERRSESAATKFDEKLDRLDPESDD